MVHLLRKSFVHGVVFLFAYLFVAIPGYGAERKCADGSCLLPVIQLLLAGSGPNINFADQQLVDVTENGGLETGSFDDGGWVQGNLVLEEDNVHSGNYAGRLYTWNGYPSGKYRMAVTPGEVYTFSCAAASADLQVASSIFIKLLDSSGDTLKTVSVASLIGTRDWQTYTSKNFRVPEDAAYLDIIIVAGAVSSTSERGGYIYFDDFKLQRNTGLAMDVVSTYESAGFTILPESEAESCTVYFRKTGTHTWHEAYQPMFDQDDTEQLEYRGSIVSLDPDTDYQVYALLTEGDEVIAKGGATFRTWSESPTIGTTYTVAELIADGRVDSEGRLDLSEISGTADAWVKITGTGSDDFAADYAENEAVYLYNNQYLILENLQITGGRRYGVHLERCHNVRIVNCDISGWGRKAGYVVDGISYENEAAYTAGTKINMDGGIFLDTSNQITVERCYLHDPRLSANSWDYAHPSGPEGIVVNGTNLTGNDVVRYNDIIGSDDLRWNDGIEGYDNSSINGSFARDSDIYGNMLGFGQDDVIELDGGQENVRFFGNKAEYFYCGISVAPNRQGPSYIFRNALFDLGDSSSNHGAAVKQGGGSDWTRGYTYFFNNTFHFGGYAGIAGVGFGDQASPERKRFYAVTRNNIVYSRWTSATAISDALQLSTNSFDYDNLVTGSSSATATVLYSDGQEAHGVLAEPPTFMDMESSEYHDDIRLAADSSAIDAGTVLANFAEDYTGAAPDQGALEKGASSLLPIRPIDITADKYRIVLSATAGGSSSSETVTLTTGDLGGDTEYSLVKNDTVDWLTVSPASGTLSDKSNVTFTFTVDTDEVTADSTEKAVVLIRLENGYSVPVTVEATID